MKHVFIINPKAGQSRRVEDFLLYLQIILQEIEIDSKVILTTQVLTATDITKKVCETYQGEPLRIYACGGDGTLHDILQGMVEFPEVELACVPLGSGNDFIRNFPKIDFFDIKNQIPAGTKAINIFEARGEFGMEYVLNVASFAWESRVAIKAGAVKKWPFIKGKSAYTVSVLLNLVHKKPVPFSLKVNDKIIPKKQYLIGAVGNGAFYGGGFMGMPNAVLDDDLLDLVAVEDIKRRQIPKLIGKFMKGSYLNDPEIKGLFLYEQAKKITINSSEYMPITLDGEEVKSRYLECKISDKKIKFVIPSENRE